MVETQLNEGLKAVEEALVGLIDTDVQTLNDASLHIITSGGKRVRPQVAFLAYMAAGGTDVLDVVNAAAAVELVHTASLVHDDINDHSALRRGKISVHARWGRTFALLTGDYMFAKVYQMMTPYNRAANKVMSQAAVTLVEGETLQADAAKRGELDRETYKRVIERKTASLFKASAELGGIIAGADEQTIHLLGEYGQRLGMTFQLTDDILDLIGDPEEMGKPAGLDMAQNRGVAAVNDNGNGVAGVAIAAPVDVDSQDPLAAMMQKLRESGAVEIARVQADRMAELAREALYQLPPSESRNRLDGIIDTVLDRTK